MVAEVPDAGHLPTKSVKITFKKKNFKQCLWNYCCQWQPQLHARPHTQGLSGAKTFANVSLIKRFTDTALNKSVLLPLTAADSQPIQCKEELPPENLPN